MKVEMNRSFENWYDLPDVAARLGVSVRTVRRAVAADTDLRGAARFVFGQWHLPESALNRWLERQPAWGSLDRRNVVARPRARDAGALVAARTEGELRRKLNVQASGRNGEVANG